MIYDGFIFDINQLVYITYIYTLRLLISLFNFSEPARTLAENV
jgi:hypothetical protein